MPSEFCFKINQFSIGERIKQEYFLGKVNSCRRILWKSDGRSQRKKNETMHSLQNRNCGIPKRCRVFPWRWRGICLFSILRFSMRVQTLPQSVVKEKLSQNNGSKLYSIPLQETSWVANTEKTLAAEFNNSVKKKKISRWKTNSGRCSVPHGWSFWGGGLSLHCHYSHLSRDKIS